MIISIYAEKAFDRIQYPYRGTHKNTHIQKIWIRRQPFQPGKGIYKKPTARTILNGDELNDFSQRSGKRQECLPLLFNLVLKGYMGIL